MKISKKLTPTTLLSIAGIGVLIACGPYYAPRLLNYQSTIIDNPPTGVDLMFPNNKKASNIHRHLENLPKRLRATYDADIADLKKASPNLAKKSMDDYKAIRSDMIINAWNQVSNDLGIQRPKDWLDEATLAAIPKEFAIYLRGAVAYRSGLPDKARKQWKALLALPAGERKYKTIWAAWMLARTSTADGEAMQWYAKVKQYKKDGFPDSIHVTDKDWTAFFSLKSGDYSTALTVYIKRGKDQSVDSVSVANDINEVFYQALNKHQKDPSPIFKTFAKNKEHAIAFSYFLAKLCRSDYYNHTNLNHSKEDRRNLALWIKALRDSKRKNIDKELGISAATAYSIHDEKSLNLCLKHMQKPTTESLWLQAKLSTLKGKLTEAAGIYLQTTQSIKSEGYTPENNELYYNHGSYRNSGEIAEKRLFSLYSEYACVELGLKHYGKALDLFLRVNNHADAAYIAETLLSPTELLQHVRNSKIAQDSEWLKALLSRKLIRNEYFKDAKSFVLEEQLKTYHSYISNYRIAIDKTLPTEKRVQAFTTSANILHEWRGTKLFYLENRSRPSIRMHAAGRISHEKYDLPEGHKKRLPSANQFTPKITSDELRRIKQNYIRISPVSTKDRMAAELLYRAAMLLPKNDDRAAKLLWQAGDITRPDPQVADKYYQSLVKRCINTPLGKACDKRRWFIHSPEIKALE